MSFALFDKVLSELSDVVEIRPTCELIEDPELYGIESVVCCVNDCVIGREIHLLPGFSRRQAYRYVILHPQTWIEYGNHLVDWSPVKPSDQRYTNEQTAIGAAIGLVFAEHVSLHGFASEIAP